jgi:hypothetical protein
MDDTVVQQFAAAPDRPGAVITDAATLAEAGHGFSEGPPDAKSSVANRAHQCRFGVAVIGRAGARLGR